MPESHDEYLQDVLGKRFCFVGGQGKSGTTWLQLILDSHPDIGCAGEGHPADVLAARLGEAIANHSEFIAGNNRLFAELQAYQGLAQQDQRLVLRAAIALLMARQCGQPLPAVIADRTPANIEHVSVLNALFPQAFFLHVLRDPRDVAVSLWYHGLRTNPDWILERYGTLDRLALQLVPAWLSGIATIRAHALACGQRYREIRYEDLHAHFEAEVTRLFAWLQVSSDSAQVAEAASASHFDKVTGGRQTGTEDRNSHFRKGVAGDWRNQLQPATRTQLEQTAGPALAALGYQ